MKITCNVCNSIMKKTRAVKKFIDHYYCCNQLISIRYNIVEYYSLLFSSLNSGKEYWFHLNGTILDNITNIKTINYKIVIQVEYICLNIKNIKYSSELIFYKLLKISNYF